MIFKDLPDVTLESGKRTYMTPDGKYYPSITTVLGATADKSFLETWRDRVGHEKAEEIVTEATINGSAMHNILEAYCLSKDHDEHSNTLAMQMAKHGFKRLDKHLTHVVQTEACLYSDVLKVAGRTDMICFWDDLLAVADYKNRGMKEFKTEEQCWDYKLQISFYCHCIYELVGKRPKLGVIIQLNAFGSRVYKFDPFDPEIVSGLNERIKTFYQQGDIT